MKLSHLTIGFLILGATLTTAQEKPRNKDLKTDTTKTVKKILLKK